ncbi:hypothetical protein GA0070624_4935 [Micromonospora rhizosphaerae]|uniref:Uncharacterized protein n=1 Tax=Micromonospora rhizosphaerae TaxID=568872 RepID=A0A1C6SXH8_9ACTN|nr:hypothetical protein GA0070624_4935 [Micromonospora rhizosphaerae]
MTRNAAPRSICWKSRVVTTSRSLARFLESVKNVGATEHGDEHVIKFTVTAAEAYERSPDPDVLAAALRAGELIRACTRREGISYCAATDIGALSGPSFPLRSSPDTQ